MPQVLRHARIVNKSILYSKHSQSTHESSRERQPGVGELRGSVVMIHEVGPAGGREPHLPAGRQRAGGGGAVAQVLRHARVVPRGRARRGVVEVHLALGSCSHFCWEIVELWLSWSK